MNLEDGRSAGSDQAWLGFADALLTRHAARRSGEAGEAGEDPDDGDIERIIGRLDEERLVGSTTFGVICANAGLSLTDAKVLALAVATEASRARRLLLGAGGREARLTVDLVGDLLGPDHTAAVAPGSRLLRAALVQLLADGAWSNAVVEVSPSVLWAMAGSDAPDPDLPLGVTQVEAADRGRATCVLVTGPDRMRRRLMAANALVADRFVVAPQPANDDEWSALVREATLTGSGVIVELDAGLPAAGRRWVDRASHLCWGVTSARELPLADLPERLRLDLVAPDLPLDDDEWAQMFGGELGRKHRLSLDQAHAVADLLGPQGGDLDAAVRRLSSGALDALTTRIRPTRSWDDIVLTDEATAQLHEVVERYRHSSKVFGDWGFVPRPSAGVVALFAGPSGTGKTLAAEIVAGDLSLDVFKLDLSSVVSKYIGETEKNLERLFEAATTGNLVLFFDEADAMFGKRSEVKDSHDRYANMEVSYLLQRLETYDGLVILATNYEKNIDDAFLRRIHVRVEFAVPESAERERIWRLNLPAAAPLGDIDVPRLAKRYEISGATIRNAALHAAFAAATEPDGRITTDLLIDGVAAEFRKAGRLLKADQFGERGA